MHQWHSKLHSIFLLVFCLFDLLFFPFDFVINILLKSIMKFYEMMMKLM